VRVNEKNLAKNEADQIITTYINLKKIEKIEKMGTSIANRHNFFLDYYNEDFINDLRSILSNNSYETEIEKCNTFLNELTRVWNYEIEDFSGMKKFELLIDFEKFTVALIGLNEEDLKKRILDYFDFMLSDGRNKEVILEV
jgi:hypothetical protein